MLKCPLYQCFDLIFGTSTGSIIASLLALGFEVDEIHTLYRKHVPAVMRPWLASAKSDALQTLAKGVFGDATFSDVKTGIGIVATKWAIERPMIFKGNAQQAHRKEGHICARLWCDHRHHGTSVLLGLSVFQAANAEAILRRVCRVGGRRGLRQQPNGLYAIADAVAALNKTCAELRVVSVGVGVYPEKRPKLTCVLSRNAA